MQKSKISFTEVNRIKKLYQSEKTVDEIAKMYNVSTTGMYNFLRRNNIYSNEDLKIVKKGDLVYSIKKIKKSKYNSKFDVFFENALSQLHPTKNKKKDLSSITRSSLKKFFFKCEYGHEFQASFHQRVYGGSSCTKCFNFSTSSIQLFIYAELKAIFKNVKHSKRLMNLDADIFIEDYNIAVEYDGYYFHKNKQDVDLAKNKLFKKNKISLIRIRDKRLKKLSKNDILFKGEYSRLQTRDYVIVVKNILKKIIANIKVTNVQKNKIQKYIKQSIPINEKYYYKLLLTLPKPPLEKSLKKTNPRLAKTWHPTKNQNLRPNMFTKGSEQVVWWKCDQNHVFDMSIKHRVYYGIKNCPYCPNEGGARRRVGYGNDLLSKYPELVKKYWDFKLNEVDPSKVSPGSHKRAYFKCKSKNPNHSKNCSYDQEIRIFVKWGVRCPYCDGKRVGFGNDLRSNNPKLAKEWHPTKNGNLTSSQVAPSSGKKVWWKCNKGHEWVAGISNRNSQGQGCIKCFKIDLLKKENLKKQNPKLAKEWHPTKNKKLTPKDVTKSSALKVWWKCNKGHEWVAAISNRNQKSGSGCPHCSKYHQNRENYKI